MKISVITVVLNNKDHIRNCIESVLDQSFPDVEYIVIDGGSTDGTIDVIRQYEGRVARLVSEPDRGIYDAMNKGIRLATGDVIGFLNADDFYAGNQVLSDVAAIFQEGAADSCYGNLVYVDKDDTETILRSWHAGRYKIQKLYRGWMPPHPTFFVRRELYEKHGDFNLAMGSAADYELMLRFLLKHRVTSVHIPKVLVVMRAGGVSNASMKNRMKANRKDSLAWKVNDLEPYPWTLLMKPLSKLGQYLPIKQLILVGGDLLLIIAAFCLAPYLRFGVFLDGSLIFDWPDLSVILIYLLSFYIFDFYNIRERSTDLAYALRLLAALATADLTIVIFLYVFNARAYPISILILNTLLIFSFCLMWRRLYYRWNREIRKVSRVLIIGAGKTGSDLREMLSQRDDFTIKGFLDDDPQKSGSNRGGVHVLGSTERLMSFLKDIDIVVVAITRSLPQNLYGQLIEAKMTGVMVYEMPSFCEEFIERIPVNHVSDLWFVYVPISGVRRNLYNMKIKRIADMLLSLLGLLITWPILILMALAIKCESRGPVFYVQRRIGWNKQPFDLVKLRTMKVGYEFDRQYAGRKDDPRITRIGWFMRFFRIDEIPQMWNVIKGEMSFIGPRALIEAEVDDFSPQIPYFSLRHSIRPGITGWAQINYPHGATVQDALAKLEYDLYYIKNLSPLLDLIILARTVRTVLMGKGAR